MTRPRRLFRRSLCVESPSSVLVLVGYHELIAVNLHLCVVPMSIVTCLEEGILQLSSTAKVLDIQVLESLREWS